MRPPGMPAPIILTREQSPSSTTSPSLASPPISKNSPSGTCVLPCWTRRDPISAGDLPARVWGGMHSASIGMVVGARYFRISMPALSPTYNQALSALYGSEEGFSSVLVLSFRKASGRPPVHPVRAARRDLLRQLADHLVGHLQLVQDRVELLFRLPAEVLLQLLI